MNKDEIGKYETILKVTSVGIAIAVVAMIILATVSMVVNPLSAQQDEESGYSFDGGYMCIQGKINLTSNAISEINGLSMTVELGAPGSTVKICDTGKMDVRAGQKTELAIDGRIPAKTYFAMMESVNEPGKGIPMSVGMSGRFIFNLVGVHAKVDTTLDTASLMQDMRIGITHGELADTAVITWGGIPMMPSNLTRIVVTTGAVELSADISNENNVTIIVISAKDGGAAVLPETVIDRITEAYKAGTLVIKDGNGNAVNLGKNTMDYLLFMIHGVTGRD
ncbi:MAG: hypothetical protein KA502_02200 [Candidatus Methanomethylophilaceae archaeon]|nr:hypothetical protein [Candidatus Methanomethylophilaceae archaeon]